ncbi:MAG: hypothetical protein O7A09_03565 [Proteobacteria bacterium]|nr:hypothetical protein [Pseudomonadota bacterium]
MRLQLIEIRRLPGIDEPLRVEGLAPGVNVVLGPNASGKSSLWRAVRATLWPDAERVADPDVVSLWDEDGVPLRAELRDGVRWQRDGVDCQRPTLPDDHLAHCYSLGMLDLLAVDGEGDRELADRIRVQMAGGYDLRAAARSFARPARHGQRERQALAAADEELHRLERERRDLGRDADALAELRADRERAEDARGEAERLQLAVERARTHAEREALRAKLATFPPELARLRGDELERLDPIAEDLGRLARESEALELRAASALRAREACACGLDGAPVDPAELAAWLARARDLERVHAALDAALRRATTARAGRDEARRALGGLAPTERELDLDGTALDEIEELAVRGWELRERRLALEARLGLGLALGETETALHAADARTDADDWARAADGLRDWLAAGSAPRGGVPLASLLGGAAVLGAALAIWVHPAFAIGAALAAGALAAALALRPRGPDERGHARERLSRLDVAAPDAWTPTAVRARLREVDQRLAEAERHQQRALEGETAAQALRTLEREDAERRTRWCALWSECGLGDLGLDADANSLRMAELASRIRDERRAARELAEAEEEVAAHETELERGLERVGAFLAERGEPTPADAAAALAGIEGLRERSHRWSEAERDRQEAERALGRVREEERVLLARRAELEARVGLSGLEVGAARKTLESFLRDFPAYRECADLERDRTRELDALQRRLEAVGREDLLQLDGDGARRRLDACLRLAERVGAIAEKMGAIEQRVRAAESGRAIEETASAVDSAREALAARRDEALEGAAGAFLLADLEEEYEKSSRPAVLDRAMRWFATFTHHHYELRLDEATGFRAVDTHSGRGLGLAELSDGTRMQLLLAARLAFATQAETGTALPLFLDEALTASDPNRFRAVAESLFTLAAEGRQVVYLTCNPSDVEQWNWVADELGETPPHPIELGECRWLAGGVTDPAELRAPEIPEVPAPEGRTAEEYGVALGVPRPDPFAPLDSVHLFHVLRGDLSLLHRLLSQARIQSVGHWRSLVRFGSAPLWVSEAESREIDARVEVFEAFFPLWRIGRGRPVDRAVLAASGAVSDVFIEPLTSLAEDLGGDARRLVAALEAGDDERTRRFRSAQREELRAFLEQEGHLDPAAPLETPELRARVVATVRARSDANLTAEEVMRCVDTLGAVVQACR